MSAVCQDESGAEAREDVHGFRRTLWVQAPFLRRVRVALCGAAAPGTAHLRHRADGPLQPCLPRLSCLQHRPSRYDLGSTGRRDAGRLERAGSASCTSAAGNRCCGATRITRSRMRLPRRSGSVSSTCTFTPTACLDLRPSADLVWVSMDGLPGTFERRRGDHFHQVERAVRAGSHPKVAVIYVIDRNTAEGIEPFLRWVHETKFPVIGVMFYFHTPYYGRDELFLTAEERAPIIDRLLGCIRAGLPVINSRAGLLALKSGDWPRRFPVASVRGCRRRVGVLSRFRRGLRGLRLCGLHRADGVSTPASERAARHDEVLVNNLGPLASHA